MFSLSLSMNKMEKEFVPYEQSVALKELGFDEVCLMYWNDYGRTSINRFQLYNEIDEWCQDYIEAPTFSQAFRFFREKHTLYHDIKMFGDWDKPQFSYIVSGRTITNPAHMWHYESKDSYEEVELECLKKLIQIVKNK